MPEDGFEKSGAKTKKEYVGFSDHLCGTACLQMALNYFGIKKKKIFELYYELKGKGLYRNGELNYQGLEEFLKKYGLKAKIYRTGLTIDEMLSNLGAGKVPVASVKRGESTHLVLITGYNLGTRKAIIHDPSGWVGRHKYYKVDIDEFRVGFNYRGFVISK